MHTDLEDFIVVIYLYNLKLMSGFEYSIIAGRLSGLFLLIKSCKVKYLDLQ
jgi:hypothetical protein